MSLVLMRQVPTYSVVQLQDGTIGWVAGWPHQPRTVIAGSCHRRVGADEWVTVVRYPAELAREHAEQAGR